MARVHTRHRGACQDLLRGLRACNVAVGNLAGVGHVTTALNGRHPATTCRRAHSLTWEALRFALLCWPHFIKIRVRLQHATTHVAREFGHARRRCAQAIAKPTPPTHQTLRRRRAASGTACEHPADELLALKRYSWRHTPVQRCMLGEGELAYVASFRWVQSFVHGLCAHKTG